MDLPQLVHICLSKSTRLCHPGIVLNSTHPLICNSCDTSNDPPGELRGSELLRSMVVPRSLVPMWAMGPVLHFLPLPHDYFHALVRQFGSTSGTYYYIHLWTHNLSHTLWTHPRSDHRTHARARAEVRTDGLAHSGTAVGAQAHIWADGHARFDVVALLELRQDVLLVHHQVLHLNIIHLVAFLILKPQLLPRGGPVAHEGLLDTAEVVRVAERRLHLAAVLLLLGVQLPLGARLRLH